MASPSDPLPWHQCGNVGNFVSGREQAIARGEDKETRPVSPPGDAAPTQARPGHPQERRKPR